jgi:hypothetical protein
MIFKNEVVYNWQLKNTFHVLIKGLKAPMLPLQHQNVVSETNIVQQTLLDKN